MGDFSLGAFFEALFKYGKDYGLTLWHFMGLGGVGVVLWIGSRLASGAGKAVQGAQSVYVKMIEDLQKKADADRADQEEHTKVLRTQLTECRADLADTQARYAELLTRAQAQAREITALKMQLAAQHPSAG